MAYLKLQQGRAIEVIPNDDINIPSPSAIAAVGVNESSGNIIKDSTKDFTKSVKIGDVVYNTTSLKIANVVNIDSANTVTISDDIFDVGSVDGYKIFSTTDVRTEPCVLYIGGSSDGSSLKVLTADDDIITFYNPARGFVLPVQVKRVFKEGTIDISEIVALW